MDAMPLAYTDAEFTAFLKRVKPGIMDFLYFRTFDYTYAKELFQQASIKALEAYRNKQFVGGEKEFASWMVFVVRNMLIDDYRKKKRMPTTSMDKEFSEGEGISLKDIFQDPDENKLEEFISGEEHAEMKAICDYLVESLTDPDQKEVVQLRIYEGLQFEKIAKRKQISINTALGMFRYARIHMLEALQKRGRFIHANIKPFYLD